MDLLDVSRRNGFWAHEGSMLKCRGMPGLEDESGWMGGGASSQRGWYRGLHRGLLGGRHERGMTSEMQIKKIFNKNIKIIYIYIYDAYIIYIYAYMYI